MRWVLIVCWPNSACNTKSSNFQHFNIKNSDTAQLLEINILTRLNFEVFKKKKVALTKSYFFVSRLFTSQNSLQVFPLQPAVIFQSFSGISFPYLLPSSKRSSIVTAGKTRILDILHLLPSKSLLMDTISITLSTVLARSYIHKRYSFHMAQ